MAPDGVFTATAPGKYRVSAEGAGKHASVEVTVVGGLARSKGVSPSGSLNFSTRRLPRPATRSAVPRGNRPARRKKNTSEGDSAAFVKTSYAPGGMAAAPGSLALTGGEDPYGWNLDNYMTADDPGGQVGDPPGTPQDGGAGNGNFQITAPVLTLPGRGIDLTLALSYNSHLWHKEGTNVTYDIDRGWPAPGWSLGFGKIADIGGGGSIIIDSDGTRHGFNGTAYPYSAGRSSFSGHTTDGTFIDYFCETNNGVLYSALAKLPNGTQILYGAPGDGAVYPVNIKDRNGNYVQITYVNNAGPRIDTVTDTLNRAVVFKYDSNGLLTLITAPGLGTNPSRPLVRLHYQQKNVNAGFTGLNVRVRNAWPWQLDAVYYPATGTGYWFGNSDSYLPSYGMIAKVIEQRGMSFVGDVTQPDMGTVTPSAAISGEADYNWLTTASAPPTYDKMTESWDGMNTDPVVTRFEVNENASPRTSVVTLPDGSKSVQYSHNTQGQYNDGLVFKDETFDTDGTTLLRRSTTDWVPGDYGSPRPSRTTMTTVLSNGTELTTGTEFAYAASPSYNQVTEVRAYDYGYVPEGSNTLLSKAVTQYENSANYTGNRHIFNLPKSVDVYASDGTTRVSRTEYAYDGATLLNTPGVVGHDAAYDPFAPQYWVPEICIPNCGSWGCSGQTCTPGHYATAYKPETNYRGNVTQATTYSNAAADPAAGATTETHTYDITGNLVTAQTACCQWTTFEYAQGTQYAYPLSQTRGSATDALKRIKTSATYDFNTGLTMTTATADGRSSSTSYFPDTLRPQTHTFPTNAHTDYSYDDAAMTVTEATYLAPPPADTGALADQSVKYLNGIGAVKQEKALGTGGVWDLVDIEYDLMGRVWRQSRPHRTGETNGWTIFTYGGLGRQIGVEGPDGSKTDVFYDEALRPDAASSAPGETVRVRDAWGRERWGRYDSRGRIVEVVEPKPDGGGSVAVGGWATTYAYDTLGNLTGTNQGGQMRSFAYDSLRRLVRQKLAEIDATLDEAGNYVGKGNPGAQWSEAFTYDERSNLTRRVDARGVVTNYDYNDPLSRLLGISYDLTGPHQSLPNSPIASAPSVAFTYRTKASAADLVDLTQPETVTATSGSMVVSSGSYGYDTEGRVHTLSLSINGRPAMQTDYAYDTLSRVVDMTYPAQNLTAGTGRKIVHHDYDAASRHTALKVDGADFASQIQYNAASQTTSLKVGAANANQVTESYSYDPSTGLLSGQKAYRGTEQQPTTLLDLSYDYLRPGTTSGRTGQLTKLTDNRDAQKGRVYNYDALGRLTHAAGGDPAGAALWTQSYSYDRWGNRTAATATGFTAALEKKGRAETREQVAANLVPPLPELFRQGERAAVSDAPDAPRLFGAARAAAASMLLDAPSNLRVTQNSSTPAQVTLAWDAPAGAVTSYRVERRNGSGQYTFVADVPAASTTFADTGVSSGAAYLYRVRASGASGSSAYSNVALATAYTFTDDPIVTSADHQNGINQNLPITHIRATHVNELRAAVNAVRHLAALADASWSQSTLTPYVTQVAADDVRELRTTLGEALSALGINAPSYTDPTIHNGQGGVRTIIKRDHFKELRLAATRGQGAGTGGSGTPVPTDGWDTLSYDSASNRINADGWEYDAAGNQTRARAGANAWQRFEYDCAGRLARVLTDDRQTVLASYTYGASNERMVAEESGVRTYYAGSRVGVLAEYTEALNSNQPQWSKSYVYLRARMLSTISPNGVGGEYVEYQHPDRLGTRLVTNAANAAVQEQTALPFGTVVWAETSATINRRFTSYERSNATGLDYAVNRQYDPRQGRFTQPDPLGMGGSSLAHPQSLNLYSYCANDPVNRTDPGGLFWGKLFKWLGKALKWIGIAAMVASAIITVGGLIAGTAAMHSFLSSTLLGKILGFVANLPSIIGAKILGVGKAIAGVFSFAGDGKVAARFAALAGYAALFGGSATLGAVSNNLQTRRGRTVDTREHPDFVRDFYKLFQQKLARCIWKVFGTDAMGNPSNGAAHLERQTLANAPDVDMSRGEMSLGGRGLTRPSDLERGKYGTVNISSNISPVHDPATGEVISSVQDQQFRTYAHELGNVLGGRLTGDLDESLGTWGSPVGGKNVPPVSPVTGADRDPGARLEECIFGNMI
jgi:RHS repeat-associated protein